MPLGQHRVGIADRSHHRFETGRSPPSVRRWLAKPTDTPAPRTGGRQVGRADLDELWLAAEDARRWDSKCGAGNAMASSVSAVLQDRAAPLLRGTYTEKIGAELFSATAELARVAAWAAVDMGQHSTAQQHFIQALRLARSAGDIQTGSYVLATMSLHAYLQGHLTEAIDMAEGAYEQGKHDAAPRVLAFAKLAEARAHGRARDARSAGQSLAAAEELLASIRPGTRDAEQVGYLTHARISTDAVEICRDLGDLKAALRWSRQAEVMPVGLYTRAVGIRRAVLSSAHIQAGELDHGLDLGAQAVEILTRVRSTRAHTYVREVVDSLRPWQTHKPAREFVRQATTALALPYAWLYSRVVGSGTDLGELSRSITWLFDCEWGLLVRPRTPCRTTTRIDAPSGVGQSLLLAALDGDGAGHVDRCTVLGLAGVRGDRRREGRGGYGCVRHGRGGSERPRGRLRLSGLWPLLGPGPRPLPAQAEGFTAP
ncbi:hypothetical protein AB0940_33350 [Streptomyces sp. NPDC006656]|uniref:hypothetical protein n=1 Tax=Streptomyces sp. NPDC006656 TaxID=3156899 RepID=UPI003453494A